MSRRGGGSSGVSCALFEQLVELLVEDLGVIFMLGQGAPVRLLAAFRLTFEPGNSRLHVGEHLRLLVLFVTDDGAGLGIDLELGLAARANHREEFGLRSGHTGIVAHPHYRTGEPPSRRPTCAKFGTPFRAVLTVNPRPAKRCPICHMFSSSNNASTRRLEALLTCLAHPRCRHQGLKVVRRIGKLGNPVTEKPTRRVVVLRMVVTP